MRVLVLSDIHANLVALEAVLKDAPQYDAVWCLGDVVGYGPAPNECAQQLRSLGGICLAGNHDWAVLGKLPLEQFNGEAQRALIWTQTVLNGASRAWLDTHEGAVLLPIYDLTLVHASPRAPIWEYILSAQVAAENMAYFQTALCFFGHTHIPIAYQLQTQAKVVHTRTLPDGEPLVLEPKLLLNPGSVGQPRDGDPRAAYAVFDTDSQTLEHYRVTYDILATQDAMEQAQLPRRLIERLAHGL